MPLPTKEQLAQMTPEEVLGLWRIVREYRLKMMALGQMPVSAIEEMTKCVGDKLMADIVNDHRRSVPEPSSLAGPVEPQAPSVRGTGWQKPAELGPAPGLKYVDEIAQHFAQVDREQMIADTIDRVRKIKG